MARGGLVNQAGTVIAVFDAASPLNNQFETDSTGNWLKFIPDLYCNLGDHWTGSAFIYASTIAPMVTPAQALASFIASGFGAQIQAAINLAAVANKNAWQPPLVNASDPIVTSAATAIGLTASQVNSLLAQAAWRF